MGTENKRMQMRVRSKEEEKELDEIDRTNEVYARGGKTMKLINGTEMIDNSPNEKAGELAEAIYDDVLFILDIEHKCIQEDEDGNTSDTEYGQDLFN
jgi:hypothetical protein